MGTLCKCTKMTCLPPYGTTDRSMTAPTFGIVSTTSTWLYAQSALQQVASDIPRVQR